MRRVLVTIDSNRVTCGKCQFLRKDQVTMPRDPVEGPDGEMHHKVMVYEPRWSCDLFGSEAHLGYVSHMKTPNRPEVCTDAESRKAVKK